jgi:hypothetical protein
MTLILDDRRTQEQSLTQQLQKEVATLNAPWSPNALNDELAALHPGLNMKPQEVVFDL